MAPPAKSLPQKKSRIRAKASTLEIHKQGHHQSYYAAYGIAYPAKKHGWRKDPRYRRERLEWWCVSTCIIFSYNIALLPISTFYMNSGLEADQKVIAAHGCYAMTATTALTAQNTTGVDDIHHTPPQFVRKQIDAVFKDIRPDVVKTGNESIQSSL